MTYDFSLYFSKAMDAVSSAPVKEILQELKAMKLNEKVRETYLHISFLFFIFWIKKVLKGEDLNVFNHCLAWIKKIVNLA